MLISYPPRVPITTFPTISYFHHIMVLVEVSVLSKAFLVSIDATADCTAQALGELALQQFKVCHPSDKPRKVLYMQDDRGVIFSSELEVVLSALFSLHTPYKLEFTSILQYLYLYFDFTI